MVLINMSYRQWPHLVMMLMLVLRSLCDCSEEERSVQHRVALHHYQNLGVLDASARNVEALLHINEHINELEAIETLAYWETLQTEATRLVALAWTYALREGVDEASQVCSRGPLWTVGSVRSEESTVLWAQQQEAWRWLATDVRVDTEHDSATGQMSLVEAFDAAGHISVNIPPGRYVLCALLESRDLDSPEGVVWSQRRMVPVAHFDVLGLLSMTETSEDPTHDFACVRFVVIDASRRTQEKEQVKAVVAAPVQVLCTVELFGWFPLSSYSQVEVVTSSPRSGEVRQETFDVSRSGIIGPFQVAAELMYPAETIQTHILLSLSADVVEPQRRSAAPAVVAFRSGYDSATQHSRSQAHRHHEVGITIKVPFPQATTELLSLEATDASRSTSTWHELRVSDVYLVYGSADSAPELVDVRCSELGAENCDATARAAQVVSIITIETLLPGGTQPFCQLKESSSRAAAEEACEVACSGEPLVCTTTCPGSLSLAQLVELLSSSVAPNGTAHSPPQAASTRPLFELSCRLLNQRFVAVFHRRDVRLVLAASVGLVAFHQRRPSRVDDFGDYAHITFFHPASVAMTGCFMRLDKQDLYIPLSSTAPQNQLPHAKLATSRVQDDPTGVSDGFASHYVALLWHAMPVGERMRGLHGAEALERTMYVTERLLGSGMARASNALAVPLAPKSVSVEVLHQSGDVAEVLVAGATRSGVARGELLHAYSVRATLIGHHREVSSQLFLSAYAWRSREGVAASWEASSWCSGVRGGLSNPLLAIRSSDAGNVWTVDSTPASLDGPTEEMGVAVAALCTFVTVDNNNKMLADVLLLPIVWAPAAQVSRIGGLVQLPCIYGWCEPPSTKTSGSCSGASSNSLPQSVWMFLITASGGDILKDTAGASVFSSLCHTLAGTKWALVLEPVNRSSQHHATFRAARTEFEDLGKHKDRPSRFGPFGVCFDAAEYVTAHLERIHHAARSVARWVDSGSPESDAPLCVSSSATSARASRLPTYLGTGSFVVSPSFQAAALPTPDPPSMAMLSENWWALFATNLNLIAKLLITNSTSRRSPAHAAVLSESSAVSHLGAVLARKPITVVPIPFSVTVREYMTKKKPHRYCGGTVNDMRVEALALTGSDAEIVADAARQMYMSEHLRPPVWVLRARGAFYGMHALCARTDAEAPDVLQYVGVLSVPGPMYTSTTVASPVAYLYHPRHAKASSWSYLPRAQVLSVRTGQPFAVSFSVVDQSTAEFLRSSLQFIRVEGGEWGALMGADKPRSDGSASTASSVDIRTPLHYEEVTRAAAPSAIDRVVTGVCTLWTPGIYLVGFAKGLAWDETQRAAASLRSREQELAFRLRSAGSRMADLSWNGSDDGATPLLWHSAGVAAVLGVNKTHLAHKAPSAKDLSSLTFVEVRAPDLVANNIQFAIEGDRVHLYLRHYSPEVSRVAMWGVACVSAFDALTGSTFMAESEADDTIRQVSGSAMVRAKTIVHESSDTLRLSFELRQHHLCGKSKLAVIGGWRRVWRGVRSRRQQVGVTSDADSLDRVRMVWRVLVRELEVPRSVLDRIVLLSSDGGLERTMEGEGSSSARDTLVLDALDLDMLPDEI